MRKLGITDAMGNVLWGRAMRTYRAFIDEIVSQHNANHGKRIDAERPHLQELPDRREQENLWGVPVVRARERR